jgi:hypothetical protein
MCLFERHCFVVQAETELLDAVSDRAYRREKGRTLAHALRLGDDEGRLFEVVLYSSDLSSRIVAGALLCRALSEIAGAT